MKGKMIAFLAVMTTSIGLANVAVAGPPVTITVKNQTPEAATYYRVGDQAEQTYTNARPKPEPSVPSFGQDSYTVQSPLSPDVNYARVYYSANGTTCNFYTSYVSLPMPGGGSSPSWNKDASPSAHCTATITQTDPFTGEWSVEFVID